MSYSTSTNTVPPELLGVPTATLQAWLTQAQAAMHTLATGASVSTVSYAQGEGQRTVSYTRAKLPELRAYVRQLQQALGLVGPRRAIGVRYNGGIGRGPGGGW